MLVSSVVHCIAVLVFQLWGVQTLSPIPNCPDSCVCEKTSLVNCASLGLSKAPTSIPATTTALDLSHNALHSLAAPLGSGHVHLRGLRHLWVGNNSLENLSMCSAKREIVVTRTRRKQSCMSWAPDLQSLSADRNQLKWLPRGLGNIKSLKVVQLSHNRISEIGPADLAGCHHLGELYLQYNLINTIHPEAFKDLQKLKVLDVSYNLLTTIPVPTFLSLRNLNALVDVSGNRWRCDCKLKTIRKWLVFDSELGNPTWEVVCSSPSNHAGTDLVDLEESDLACPQPVYNTPGVKKEVTVDEGMELILSCSTANQDFMHIRWWTPHGPISDSQQLFHISNTTERDAGLYICVSGYQEEHVSVFDIRIRRKAHDRRLRREALIGSAKLYEGDNDNMQRNVPAVRAVQQSQFVLAVCLSVFITFIVAFILGVILRPFLEKCFKQIQNKRNSKRKSASNLQTSSTEQRPYVNEGYSDTDDQELEVHKGPRVTFGGVTEIHEQGNVPYYVTVEDNPSGSNADVVELYENAEEKESMTKNIEVHKEVPLREENIETTSPRSIESQYEYIPDPEDTTELEDRSISPASSLSGERQEPQVSYETNEYTEQSVDSPTVSVYEEEEEGCTDLQATIPGFITDPFPLKVSESKEESVDELDPDLWNDSGESFSFTEGSPRSSSRISSNVADLGRPPIQKEMSVDELSDRPSSSESEEREEGPTEYVVNPENDEDSETQIYDSENDDQIDDQKTGTGARFRQDTITLDPTDIHMINSRGDSFDDEQFTEYKECFDSSNVSSEDEDEPTQYNVHPVYRTSGRTISLMGEDRSRTSSYSETNQDKEEDDPMRLEIRLENKVPTTDAIPVISPNRLLDIGYDNTPSSTDIEDKRSEEKEKGIRKSLSGISALLFNRSGSETNKDVQPEPNSPTSNSKSTGGFLGLSFKKQPSESGNPTTNDSNFFATIGQAFDRLPKLKNSLLFSISAPKPPHQQSTSVKDRMSESQRPHVSSSFEESIFGKIDRKLYPIPQVKRYLHFSRSKSYPTIQALPQCGKEEITRNESKKFTSTSEDDARATTKGDNFFSQIDASFEFSPSELKPSNHSVPLASINQEVRSELVSKTESPPDTFSICFEGQSIPLYAMPKVQRYIQFTQSEPQTIHEITPAIKEDSFIGQMCISCDDLPKVMRYIQFSPSESQISNHSAPSGSIDQLVRLVSKTESPPEAFSICFEGQSIPLYAMPKVQRYIQFTQSEPQPRHELTPTFKEDSFIGQMQISCDDLPKVKRYVQFSPSKPLNHSSPAASITQVVRSEAVSKTESPPDTFSICFEGQSIPLRSMPKVQRYVQFTQYEPQSKHLLTPTIIGDSFIGQIPVSFDKVPKVKRHILFSQVEPYYQSIPPIPPPRKSIQTHAQLTQSKPQTGLGFTPAVSKDSFFSQIGASIDDLPKVKRYVQFSPSESQVLNHSAPSASIKQAVRSEAVSKTESPPDTLSICFEGQSIPLRSMPKVQRYVQFTQSEPQPKHLLTPTIIGDSFIGQIPVSFDEVPKVKRHILFSQVEPYYQSIPPIPPPRKSIQTHAQLTQSKPQTGLGFSPAVSKDSFFSQIGASIDDLPKVKRYVQFSPSESQVLNYSAPSGSIKQVVRSEGVSKTESPPDTFNICFEGQSISLRSMPKVQRYIQFTQSEPQRKHLLTPTIIGDSFFGQIPVLFDEVPKVKRHILFSQVEPHYQTTQPIPPPRKSIQTHAQLTQSKPQTVHGFTPVVNEDSFFSQIGASIDDLPKVKRYIQFSPSESQVSNHSTPSGLIKQVVRSEAVSKTESPPDTFSICFEGQSIPLRSMPKVQRYIQFTQSEPQPKHLLTPTIIGDSFIGQIPVSFDEVPKVKRHILFSQVEPYYQTTPPTRPPRKSIQTHAQLTQSKPQTGHGFTPAIKEDSFFSQIGASIDDLPKVKRYIQFSPSESQVSNHSTPSGSIKQVVRSEAVSKTESPSDTFNICFEGQSISLRSMPKVQRYVQFTQSEPRPKHLLTPTIIGDSFIGQIPVSFDEVPKVKRHILFSQVEPYYQTLPPTRPPRKSIQTHAQLTQSMPQTGHGFTPAVKEDSFFSQIGASIDDLPKVKRYVQFSPSESKPLNHLTISASINQVVKSELVSKTESPPDTFSICFEGQNVSLLSMPKIQRYVQFSQSEAKPMNHLTTSASINKEVRSQLVLKKESPPDTISICFEGQSISLHAMPKVQKYIQFTQAEPQPRRLLTPTIIGDSFFGQIPVSFDKVPKVKRHIMFSQVEPYYQPTPPIPPPRKSIQTHAQLTQSKPQTVHGFTPAVKENSFFSQIGASVDDLPKVKRYIQFSPSESQVSNHSIPSASINQVVRSEAVSKTESPPDTFNICFEGQSISLRSMPKVQRYVQFTQSEPQSVHEVTSALKKNSFFGQMDASFDDLPKVKRYVQFSPFESQPSASIKQVARPTPASSELKKDVSDYIQPAAGEHSMFGPIGASTGIPKVRRYIQFSERPTLSSHRQTATPVLTKPELDKSSSLPVHSKSDYEDTVFKKMDSSVSELPKVKRYIQFTHHPAPLEPSNTIGVRDDIAKKKELWGSNVSKPPVTGDNFFGQVGTNFTSLPKVNRYIQFTQSEPHSSSQLQPQTGKMTGKEWKTISSTMDTNTNLSNFFDGAVASLDNIPKVKKALLFTQSGHQNFNQTEVPQKVTAQSVTKSQSTGSSSLSNEDVFSTRQDKFFGQLGVSLDEVPKVKKYIQFSQSEAYTPTQSSVNIKGDQSPLPIFKTEIVTPELITKTEPSSANSQSERKHRTDIQDDIFFGKTDTSFNEVPKVKRYLQFTKAEPEPAAPSFKTSVITEHVTPEFSTKMQSTRFEGKSSPTNKGDDFFGQTGTSFAGMPKVKRYIQFTQAEPHIQPSMTEKTIPASSELKTKHMAKEYIQSAAGEHNVFEPIGASSEIPKVRRYMQFSQRSTNPLYQTATPVLTKPDVRQSSSLPVHSKSDNEDTFFKTMDPSASELPKVKRYIQFTQHDSTLPKPSNTHEDTDDVAKRRELRGSDLSVVDVKTPEDSFLGQLETKVNSLPRVNRYIQFTQAEPYPSRQPQPYHNRTATDDESSQAADYLFGSLDVSYNQVPTVKRYVQIEQSEPHRSSLVPSKFLSLESEHRFPSEKGFKLTTKKNDSFGQTDGVPRLIKYTQVQSEPHTQNQEQSLQDATSAVKVTTETSTVNQPPEPKRSFLSNPDAYRLQDQVEEVFRQTSSVSSSGNIQGSITVPELKLSRLGASTRKHLDTDPVLHDISQSAPDPPEDSSEKDSARKYLRDSSLARQRQERRRVLFQQKKRAMDGFSLTSDSFTSQESDQ